MDTDPGPGGAAADSGSGESKGSPGTRGSSMDSIGTTPLYK
jgi:hypothetical protein